MQKSLFIKLGIIGFLSLLILIPLSLIQSKVSERQSYRDQVVRDIASSWSERQTFTGPIIVVPVRESYKKSVWDKNLEEYVERKFNKDKKLYFFPEQLDIKADVKTELRKRSLYKVPVYKVLLDVAGHFSIPKELGMDINEGQDIQWQEAFLLLGVEDLRGIRSGLKLDWNGKEKEFRPGTKLAKLPIGVHVGLGDVFSKEDKNYNFAFSMFLKGTSSLKITPAGKQTNIDMQSPWLHPKFVGHFLPDSYLVKDDGFSARWENSHFSTNVENAFANCSVENCSEFNRVTLGVELIQPVDMYQQAERAIKYGILFVVLTFAIFFMFEILRSLKIHPVQYGLVGLALALFYQLLISLSEHIAFSSAYLVAALACVGLIAFYISYVLKSLIRSVGIAATLSTLYGVLYMILLSEDYASLMGTMLFFLALAVIMFTTRKVDWYQAGEWLGKSKIVKPAINGERAQ